MNSYAYQIQPADRWAIVAYIRALQVSQNPDEESEQMRSVTKFKHSTSEYRLRQPLRIQRRAP